MDIKVICYFGKRRYRKSVSIMEEMWDMDDHDDYNITLDVFYFELSLLFKHPSLITQLCCRHMHTNLTCKIPQHNTLQTHSATYWSSSNSFLNLTQFIYSQKEQGIPEFTVSIDVCTVTTYIRSISHGEKNQQNHFKWKKGLLHILPKILIYMVWEAETLHCFLELKVQLDF